MVFGHGDRPDAKFVNRIISCVGFPFKNPSISVIRLLNLPNNNGLELTTRSFKI